MPETTEGLVPSRDEHRLLTGALAIAQGMRSGRRDIVTRGVRMFEDASGKLGQDGVEALIHKLIAVDPEGQS